MIWDLLGTMMSTDIGCAQIQLLVNSLEPSNAYIYICICICIYLYIYIYIQQYWFSIGSDNGLSPVRRQAITWTTADLLLTETLQISFLDVWYKHFHVRTLIRKCRLQNRDAFVSFGLDVLKRHARLARQRTWSQHHGGLRYLKNTNIF